MFRALFLFLLMISATAAPARAAQNAAAAVADGLAAIEDRWVDIRYDMKDSPARFEAAAVLKQQSLALMEANPGTTEAKVWHARVLLLEPELHRDLASLGQVREAKKLLEEAEAENPTAMGGHIYTDLGMLYADVPGWPIGFGDDKKADAYLRKALMVDPGSMDTNYLYGNFLADRGKLREARALFEAAARAPIRPDHVRSDTYRHQEIVEDLAALRKRMKL